MKGLVFDLDGVITDTAKYHFIAWGNAAKKIGIEIDEKLNEQLKGRSREDSLEMILKHGNKENEYSSEEKAKICTEKNNDYVKLLDNLSEDDILPGMKSIIDQAKELSWPMAVASASKNASYILKKLGILEEFVHVVDAATVVNSKPDPEVFLKACTAIGVEPEDAIGFEDAQAGIDALNSAGIYSIGVEIDGELKNGKKTIDTLEEINLSQL